MANQLLPAGREQRREEGLGWRRGKEHWLANCRATAAFNPLLLLMGKVYCISAVDGMCILVPFASCSFSLPSWWQADVWYLCAELRPLLFVSCLSCLLFFSAKNMEIFNKARCTRWGWTCSVNISYTMSCRPSFICNDHSSKPPTTKRLIIYFFHYSVLNWIWNRQEAHASHTKAVCSLANKVFGCYCSYPSFPERTSQSCNGSPVSWHLFNIWAWKKKERKRKKNTRKDKQTKNISAKAWPLIKQRWPNYKEGQKKKSLRLKLNRFLIHQTPNKRNKKTFRTQPSLGSEEEKEKEREDARSTKEPLKTWSSS